MYQRPFREGNQCTDFMAKLEAYLNINMLIHTSPSEGLPAPILHGATRLEFASVFVLLFYFD